MHGRGIGQGHCIAFTDIIRDAPAITINRDLACVRVNLRHLPHVTVRDIVLVVIDRLDHRIARSIRPPKPRHAWRRLRIEGLLEHSIERSCAKTAPVHGRQHLHSAHRMEPKALGNPFGHDAHGPCDVRSPLLSTPGNACSNKHTTQMSSVQEAYACHSV